MVIKKAYEDVEWQHYLSLGLFSQAKSILTCCSIDYLFQDNSSHDSHSDYILSMVSLVALLVAS